MDNQIQCPNCGGYDIKPTNTGGVMEAILTFFGLLFYIIPGVLMMKNQNKRDSE